MSGKKINAEMRKVMDELCKKRVTWITADSKLLFLYKGDCYSIMLTPSGFHQYGQLAVARGNGELRFPLTAKEAINYIFGGANK